MARIKWSGRLDGHLLGLVREQADALERSEAYVVETSLREMFSEQLPPGWKPGQSENDSDDGTTERAAL